jgi:hypothetical protein
MIQSMLEVDLCAQNLAAVKLITNSAHGQPKNLIGALETSPTGKHATPLLVALVHVNNLPAGQALCKSNSMLSFPFSKTISIAKVFAHLEISTCSETSMMAHPKTTASCR